MALSGNNDLVGEILILCGFAVYFFFRRWLNNRPSDESMDITSTSLILTIYTMGVTVQKLSEGSLQGNPYRFLITVPIIIPSLSSDYEVTSQGMPIPTPKSDLPAGVLRAPTGQTIMCIDLPTKSEVHFAGFSLQDSVFRQLLGNTNLDNMLGQVQLEGDFPDYFKLYCDKGREIELLEVLDPTRMAFLVDFCKKFNWELFDNNLYFVQSETTGSPGDVTLVDAAQEFAIKILPTLQRMSLGKGSSQLE